MTSTKVGSNKRASEASVNYVMDRMSKWDGMDPVPIVDPLPPIGPVFKDFNEARVRQWMHACYEFQMRVRRDILVLERVLIEECNVDEAHFYGDPGDPPPDPDM
jgi:hypothetical protein